MRRLPDHDERERIRASLDESLIVEAAAGTGKTSELVRRLINVLGEGRGTVQTVAALTFTEKAAGDLKLRLRAGLEEERRAAAQGTARREHLEDAIAELEEARISTIHGFCKDLLQERPVEARVDPRFQVLDEAEARALYGQAFDRWLEGVLADPAEGVRRALRRGMRRRSDDRPTDRLRQAGWTLTEWRDLRGRWRRPTLDRNAAIDALVERIHTLAGRLAVCSRHGDGLYRNSWRLRRLSEDLRVSERIRSRDHDGLEAALVELAEDRTFRQPGKGAAKYYGGEAALAQILKDHAELVEKLDDFSRVANADLAALLHGELGATIESYEKLKARAGRVDFFDLLVRTRDLVRDRRDVRADLQGRFTHIFVDEFQDTDPLQAEILLLLAAADPAVEHWRQVTPAPGKLFIVGDPKQSIYRFRRADVGVYQEVKKLLAGRGVACLSLRTSFRAVPSLQRLVNAAFAPVMAEDRGSLQAGYVPLGHHRDELPGQPSIVALPVPKPYGGSGITKTAINESLPDTVAAFVQWLIAESGWRVTERDRPGETLPITPRHVCLLFRRFSSWQEDVTRPFVEALEARDIPHLLVGGKSFHLREEVESLRTALTAIEWPDDELSVYATLKGPLFAIGDEELLEYRQRFRRLHPYRVPALEGGEAKGEGDEPMPDRLGPVIEVLALLRELNRRRNSRPVEETVRALLAATRAHAAFLLRPWGEQALANVMRVTELARAYEVGGGISFRGFVTRLREEAEAEVPEAPIVEEASEGVRLMTVHRAKGLEFPIVVLADFTANIAPERPSRHVDAERGICALGLSGWLPLDLLEHEAEELARERAEGVRVAYVAATRARDLLVVPAVGDDPRESGWEAAEDAWVAPVQRAIYPVAARRRASAPAPGCPAFGEDSVLVRPDRDAPGAENVRPGLHPFGAGDDAYAAVWWDPSRLALGVKPLLGLRRRELLEDPGPDIVDADRKAYADWLSARAATIEYGSRPSVVVETVTEWISRAGRGRAAPEVSARAAAVEVVRLPRHDPSPSGEAPSPSGPRYGTLVHAILAAVPLDGDRVQVETMATLQGRILGATADEITSAAAAVSRALAHPLLARAREAWRAGKCRREVPITLRISDPAREESLIEGVVDVAFQDDAGWTVIDFKTDHELDGRLDRYRRQVALYATAIAQAVDATATAVLVAL